MRTNAYTELIAGAHRNKERFTEWVYALTDPLNLAREKLIKMQTQFDIETAVGDQLDAVGVRVGISRILPVKLTGVYFALDDDGGVGLDLGIWKGEFDPDDGLISLDDHTYRAVIKSKILMNHWDGTNETLHDFIDAVLGYFGVSGKIVDLQDLETMRVALNLSPDTTPQVVYELLSRRIIDVVAAGVALSITDNRPWFGFDFETQSVKGVDEGLWFPLA